MAFARAAIRSSSSSPAGSAVTVATCRGGVRADLPDPEVAGHAEVLVDGPAVAARECDPHVSLLASVVGQLLGLGGVRLEQVGHLEDEVQRAAVAGPDLRVGAEPVEDRVARRAGGPSRPASAAACRPLELATRRSAPRRGLLEVLEVAHEDVARRARASSPRVRVAARAAWISQPIPARKPVSDLQRVRLERERDLLARRTGSGCRPWRRAAGSASGGAGAGAGRPESAESVATRGPPRRGR